MASQSKWLLSSAIVCHTFKELVWIVYHIKLNVDPSWTSFIRQQRVFNFLSSKKYTQIRCWKPTRLYLWKGVCHHMERPPQTLSKEWYLIFTCMSWTFTPVTTQMIIIRKSFHVMITWSSTTGSSSVQWSSNCLDGQLTVYHKFCFPNYYTNKVSKIISNVGNNFMILLVYKDKREYPFRYKIFKFPHSINRWPWRRHAAWTKVGQGLLNGHQLREELVALTWITSVAQ